MYFMSHISVNANRERLQLLWKLLKAISLYGLSLSLSSQGGIAAASVTIALYGTAVFMAWQYLKQDVAEAPVRYKCKISEITGFDRGKTIIRISNAFRNVRRSFVCRSRNRVRSYRKASRPSGRKSSHTSNDGEPDQGDSPGPPSSTIPLIANSSHNTKRHASCLRTPPEHG